MGNANTNSLTVTLDEIFYNDLNRASREYDASVTDCYYYIINGGAIDDVTFTRLLTEAIDFYYAYAILKDKVTNDYVVPAIAQKYDVDPKKCLIYNSWNIPFDGSQKCVISDIRVNTDARETVVYESECPDAYIENVAKLKVKIDIINSIISKLNSTTLADFAEASSAKLKQQRLDLMQQDLNNTNDFMLTFVTPKIKELGENPETLVWTINTSSKKFTLTKKIFSAGIICERCNK